MFDELAHRPPTPAVDRPAGVRQDTYPSLPRAWKPPTSIRHLLGLVNQNCMTSCVMAAETRRRPDPVFVLKLIGDLWMMEALRNAQAPNVSPQTMVLLTIITGAPKGPYLYILSPFP